MRIVVPTESAPLERRVALTPDAVRRLSSEDTTIVVERGAGLAASFTDEQYAEAGAELAEGEAVFDGADLVLMVSGPGERTDGTHQADALPSGSILASLLRPHAAGELLEKLAARGVTALAMELMPRTTAAQRMDALSAFSTVAGYSAVLRGAEALDKFFPMLTTAAGTIAPANVFVIGAGVAGLQAIATARRLGAVVEAFDIRPAVKEQVESLGARFVEWEADEEAEAEGGYAKQVSAEEEERERQLLAEHVGKADVVITTAMVPGKPAPRLIDADMVAAMRPGSVIVDLAAETGGNCELTRAGETVEESGVRIMGPLDLATSLPFHGSQMYGRILGALVKHIAPGGAPKIDLEDEITDAICVVHDGTVRYQA